MGGVDVLVNNAGIMRQTGGISDPIEEWDAAWTEETMTVNVHAPARLMRHAVRDWLGTETRLDHRYRQLGDHPRHLEPRRHCLCGLQGRDFGRDQDRGAQLRRKGILAYVIAPGVVRTQMSVDTAAKVGGEAAVTATLPMGEWVPPEDIAETAVFLASGRARHLTGATIDVNGAAYIR
jgi:NAD(P)-dependent dehydrogenase (short-subunit alcohol dehydrogenase family)